MALFLKSPFTVVFTEHCGPRAYMNSSGPLATASMPISIIPYLFRYYMGRLFADTIVRASWQGSPPFKEEILTIPIL